MSPSPEMFDVHMKRRNGVVRVAVRGELDLASAPTLEKSVSEIEADGVRGVILDLRDLVFIDSTGLRILIGLSQSMDHRPRVAIVGASDRVLRVFVMTGTDRILNGSDAMQLLKTFTRDPDDPSGLG